MFLEVNLVTYVNSGSVIGLCVCHDDATCCNESATEAIMNLSNHYLSIPTVCRHAAVAIRAAAFALLVGVASPVAAQTAPGKSIQTFLLYYGGGATLVASDAAKLAKFDLLGFDRFRYNQIGSNTWAAIKALNPNMNIYLYVDGPNMYNDQDANSAMNINTLARYNVSRGHPMGSLNGNHPELFQLDSGGNRIYNNVYSNPGANHYFYLMDFGSSAYQSYWVTALKADIADQPWVADGVFTDDCIADQAQSGYNATSAKYPTDATFSAAVNTFVSAISTGLHGYGQKLWCNKGETRMAIGSAAWLSLDASASPPDAFLEEGAFAVMWGPWATQFLQESEWKSQIDTIAALRNTKAATLASTQLFAGQTGSDNFGNTVSFWQTLWYSLGPYLLAKNDVLGTYFMFHGAENSNYDQILRFDEYDKIDLGKALGSYTVRTIGGVNIYSREFEKGYVYVNPTANVASVALPQAGRQLTHDNLLSALDTLPLVSSVSLIGHSTAIVLKTTVTPPDTIAPSTPAGLSASAVSSSQINLSWNASTDNVAVVNYQVILNDAIIANVPGTSFQHTGLTPGTTYNYRVSAADAVPNYSAWTATPVSVTTPAATDTTAPSTPTGLLASAVSSSQINLSWAASTDNVGVTGYLVYDADTGSTIATTTTTSFTHSGLVPGTTHNYRVSAFDAVPNHSPWTDPPVSVTTLPPDTTAPSTPTEILASAVSSSQINLSWTASTDDVKVTRYIVRRDGVKIATPVSTSYADTGLSAATTYSYTVAARDAAGNISPISPSVSVTTASAADTTPPVTPSGLTAAAAGSTGANLSWSASTDNVGVTGYIVRRDGVQVATPATTSYADAGLSAAATYNYTVAARDAAGNSSPISASVGVTTGSTPPPPPSNSASLAWDSVTDPNLSGYRLYFGTAPGAYLQALGQGTSVGNVTTYTVMGLASGTRYYFAVTAFDTLGIESNYSNEVFKDIP